MKHVWKLSVITCMLAALAAAQAPAGYVDMFIVKVKPERRTDFDAVAKKIADANHKHKGSQWLAYATEYGEQHTVMFSSVQDSYAGIEKASAAFLSAMKEGYGPSFPKLFQEADACMISSRGEVRRRRPDLSWNLPSDIAGIEKHVGESRLIRVLTSRVRPGRAPEYEEIVKTLKAAFEKGPNRTATFVSQAVAGQPSGTFYFTTFARSLADFDVPPGTPALRERLGNDAFERYMKTNREVILSSETTIARILPALSNPPDGITSAAPEFWRPKPAATPKPKSASAAKTGN